MKRTLTIEAPCIVCGSTSNPHKAKGKCRNCYQRELMNQRFKDKKAVDKKA